MLGQTRRDPATKTTRRHSKAGPWELEGSPGRSTCAPSSSLIVSDGASGDLRLASEEATASIGMTDSKLAIVRLRT